MLQDGLAFWNALKKKIVPLIRQEASNCLRCERYDVTTAPNGTKIGVTLPEGTNEILIPYSKEVRSAQVGDTVMVVWHGTLSTAKAFWFGNGYAGEEVPSNVARKVIVNNVQVAATSTVWVSDSTYTDYPYKATLTSTFANALADVTSNMVPYVIFNVDDASSGNFASVANSVNGGVEIYAKEIPDSAIQIPTIMCIG